MKKTLDIFADGSCSDNGRPNAIGGWSFVVAKPGSTEVIIEQFGKLRLGKQTNNRAELESCYQALLWIDKQSHDGTIYRIYSDSEVVIKGINGKSGRNANRDMWDSFETLCKRLIIEGKLDLHSFNDVDAHQEDSDDVKHIMNCIADKLAKQGANSLLISPIRV